MRRTPIVVAAAALLALGACGGGGGKKAAVSTGSSTTAPTAAVATGDAATSPTSAGSPSAAASSPATTAAATATTAKPASHPAATTAPAPATQSQQASTPNQPTGASGFTYPGKPTTQAGHYQYAVSGTSTFGAPPPTADLVVDAPQGSTQHSKVTTQTTQGSSSTDTTLDFQADGVHLVDLTTESSGQKLQFHPSPAPLIFPADFAQGKTVGPFTMTSSDGKESASVKVTIQQVNAPVASGDGVSHNTVQAQVDTTLSCTNPADTSCLSGTLNSTRWIDEHALQIKTHDVSDISFGAYKFTSDTTSLLNKATPS